MEGICTKHAQDTDHIKLAKMQAVNALYKKNAPNMHATINGGYFCRPYSQKG